MMSKPGHYKFEGTVSITDFNGTWYFITLPSDLSDEIDAATIGSQGGWGSVRVTVTIGKTTWKTSLFPDKKAEAFVLPIKALVRKNEGLGDGSVVTVSLTLGG